MGDETYYCAKLSELENKAVYVKVVERDDKIYVEFSSSNSEKLNEKCFAISPFEFLFFKNNIQVTDARLWYDDGGLFIGMHIDEDDNGLKLSHFKATLNYDSQTVNKQHFILNKE